MEAWMYTVPYVIAVYSILFTRGEAEPYRIGATLKQRIESLFVVFCWRMTYLARDDNPLKLIGLYIFLLQYIPLYNSWLNYPNFGRLDCSLALSIQAAMFLTRAYTHAHTVLLVLGFILQTLKNRVFYAQLQKLPADSDDDY
ncbi:hypothetical protein PHJA_001659900 [Phtheirospermum japonicum]|uniref:Uncharacterized protein n=1 Tax=Phtheirospermum japonicum TaxID=374723 RepID=A0A830CJ68_9LAMI|nr:hypothetical protein PHJA_001659900 [Phtheirospermum japonicum]